MARALEGVNADDRGQKACAHYPSDAGRVALVQGGDGTVGAVHACEQVTDRDPDAGGMLGVRTGQGHQAGLTLGDLVVAGSAALGPVMAEATDRQDHQGRVELVQPLDREPEPVHDARPEVLDQHVTLGGQPSQGGHPVLALEVEGDRLLVAVAGQEVRRDRVFLGPDERGSPAAGVIATAGALDLDDARTHVAQHHGGVRAGQGSRQVDDDDVVQRTDGFCHPGHSQSTVAEVAPPDSWA